MSLVSIPLVLALPAMLAAALAVPGLRAAVWRLVPLAALPGLGLALLSPGDATVVWRGDWLILGIELGTDPVARVFLAFTAVLWIAAGAAGRHWMRGDDRATVFGLCLLLAMTGNLGLILARDALSFYAFFALMSFASYGLVIHDRGAPARAAARLYIAFVIAGELALFAGLALASAQAGSLLLADLRVAAPDEMTVLLLLAGFGVKLGLVPLHFWLPPAHGAAPVPASAVLSGAMIKAGLFGMIATLPLGVAAWPDLGALAMSVGLVTIFAALVLGVQQTNAKAVLGYSSVSQMGIIAIGLGAGLLAPGAWAGILPALVFLATHHALAKGALFLGVGAVAAQGQARTRWAMIALMAVPALILAGLPATSGAMGKEALKQALGDGSTVWLPWLTVALTLSGLATTLLMARHLVLLGRGAPKAPAGISPDGMALPFLALTLAALSLPALWPGLSGPLGAPIAMTAAGTWWPLVLGMFLALAAWLQAHAQRIGPAAFAAQLTAPGRRVQSGLHKAVAARRRALRRLSQRIPRQIGARATDWRLGHTAILVLIALVMALQLAEAPRAAPDPDPQGAADAASS